MWKLAGPSQTSSGMINYTTVSKIHHGYKKERKADSFLDWPAPEVGPGEPLSAPSAFADLSLKTFPSSHLWPIRLSDWKHSHSCWKNHFCRPYSFKSRLMTKIWYGSIFSFVCWSYYSFITLRGTMGVEKKYNLLLSAGRYPFGRP